MRSKKNKLFQFSDECTRYYFAENSKASKMEPATATATMSIIKKRESKGRKNTIVDFSWEKCVEMET